MKKGLKLSIKVQILLIYLIEFNIHKIINKLIII